MVSLCAVACGGEGLLPLPGGEAGASTTLPETTTAVAAETTAPSTESTAPSSESTAPSSESTAPSTESTAPSTDSTESTAPNTTEVPGLSTFPVTVPSGECTAASIRATTGIDLVWGPECAGAWAIGQGFECDPESECEGVDIMRWTDAGWQYRNLHFAYCVLSVQMSGMSRAANDQLLGDNTFCVEPIRFSAEPTSGALALGHEGSRVARLQQALINLRLLDDIADGRFGPNTQAAVIDLQFLAGIDVSQQADDATHRVLRLPF
jgi:hypothetical protein